MEERHVDTASFDGVSIALRRVDAYGNATRMKNVVLYLFDRTQRQEEITHVHA